MKAKLVPALRSTRGLHRGSGAEPPVVGLAPQTKKEKKADTMKTYLRKTSPAVEPKAKGEDIVIAGRDDFYIVPFVPLGSANIHKAGLGRPMTTSAYRNHILGPSTIIRLDHGRGGTRPYQTAALRVVGTISTSSHLFP